MPSGGVLRTLWRHKVLTVVGVLMSAAAAFAAGRLVGPSYTAGAIVVLLPPAHDQQIDNPYLYLGGIQQARDVVQRSLVSEGVRADIARAEPAASYDVEADPLSEGPLLVVSTEASTADAALGSMRAVLAKVPPTVRSLQQRMAVQRGADITPLTVTQDQVATVVTKGQVRAGLGVAVLVAVLSVLGIGLVDGPWARRRAARRAAKAAEGAEDAEAVDDTGETEGAEEPAGDEEPAAEPVAARESDPAEPEGPERRAPRVRHQRREHAPRARPVAEQPRGSVPVKTRSGRPRAKRNLQAARGEAGS